MIQLFKQCFLELRDQAIDNKKDKAKIKGDESLWKKEIWASPDKNKEIKARFRDEGERLGYRSRPSYKTKVGEWLYDFVWREFDEQDNLKRVVLTMEIEMSDRHFKYDFNKLLQSDSQYKIMVIQVKDEYECQKVFESLEEAINLYEVKVISQYLLVGWCTSKNDFMFREISV